MRLARRRLLALWALLLPVAPSAAAERVRLLVQSSPLAGSQYYALDALQGRMAVGDRLTLVREPDNRHDPRAIRVEWRGVKLGYVPRRENRLVAAALDAGDRLLARIAAFGDDPDPWRRLRFDILIEL